MFGVKCFIQNLVLMSAALNVPADQAKQKEIAALEKEKDDLVKEIHIAIDDSVNLLQKDNTTQNMQGVKYMLHLKQQIPKINNTFEENIKLANENSSSEMENRRMFSDSMSYFTNRYTRDPHGSTLDRAFDIDKVLYGKKYPVEKIKQLMISRIEMQKKLDEWILQRELEKEKRRERFKSNKKLVLMGLLEKCPRLGTKKRQFRRRYKEADTSSSDNTDSIRSDTDTALSDSDSERSDIDCKKHGKRKSRRRSKKTYPCCRKCCKKSYLGCL